MGHFSSPSNHYNGGDEGQTSGVTSGDDYEVFLNFGEETRRGFADHLYNSLDKAGISVFRDEEELPMGERNWPELLKAIEASKISILIISPDYTSSERCLNELVHVLKCNKTFGQIVIPIFYQVKPSDIRNNSQGSIAESRVCKKRRHGFEGMHVGEWKDALREVSYMKGLESEKIADGFEGVLVEVVVAKVLAALQKLVGVQCHVEKIIRLINQEECNDVRAILIHGMGGIGKTTLAKALYDQLADLFDYRSYLADVRRTSSQFKGLEGLQEKLVSDILGQKQSIWSVDDGVKIIKDGFRRKKVLIWLDDVDCSDQLNALAGTQDWFGKGSVVIITSRKKNILEGWDDSFSYELKGLNYDQSFELFLRHAFRGSHSIPSEFHAMANNFVLTTSGIPLAIEIIGCLLYGEDQHIWEEKWKKLRELPPEDVQFMVKISFDALKHEEKEIFLDIACLPIHEERELALHMWDSCGLYPELGIKKLISMSLIKIGERGELIIHDQLRDLGRECVRLESLYNPRKHSRLWRREEALEVLELKQGGQEIQTLNLWCEDKTDHFTSRHFEGMTELRYLNMRGVHLEGDFENLFQNLRWLKWADGKLDSLNFIPKKLVVLELTRVNIIDQCIDWSQLKDLRVLKLMDCPHSTTFSDFSVLEELRCSSSCVVYKFDQ